MEGQKLVVLVCHAEVHDGKNHENKRLKRDNQNVENSPTPVCRRAAGNTQKIPAPKSAAIKMKIISPRTCCRIIAARVKTA